MKSNHIVTTVKQQLMIYYFHCYAETLAGELNPDLKAHLNGNPSICYLIQGWIRLKKLYFHRKWQNQFTHKFDSIFIICRNFIWMKNLYYLYYHIYIIYIIAFSERFPNQWKKQTSSKVISNILPLYKASFWICWLNLREKWIRLSNLFKFSNLMFVL